MISVSLFSVAAELYLHLINDIDESVSRPIKNGISSIINSTFTEEDDLNQKDENEKPEPENKENNEGQHQKN